MTGGSVMNDKVIKAPSDEAMAALIKGALGALPGNKAVAALRADAAATFDVTGLPHRRVEEWKYSDLRRVMPRDLALSGPVDLEAARKRLVEGRTLKDVKRARIVLVNGTFEPDLSKLDDVKDEISIRSVADALTDGSFPFDDPEIAKGDMALGLNTALLQDGVIVEIPEGHSLSMPLEIRNVMQGEGLSTIRNRVVLGKGASADILETFIGDEAAYQVNAAMDYRVADEARINVMRMINEGAEAIHVGSTTVVIGAEARFEHFTMATGGKFSRSQSFVCFEGEYSDAELIGSTIIGGDQHSDITLTVDHAVPNCNSKEQYRTVMDGKAEGVFQGKIIVRQPAQKTDGRMMSQALLLSEDAAFFNKPELEIFADDVQCAHGATCGELDEDLLFYLRARGIPLDKAKKMLVLAFLAEVVEQMSNEQFVAAVEGYVADWLGLDH